MAELQKELGETQAEEAIQNQQDSLDAMQEAYEEQKDQEIAALEETISSTQKLYDMAYENRSLPRRRGRLNALNCWDTLRAAMTTTYG